MLNVTYRPLADLVPYGRNSRVHSDEQINQVAESIRQFGWTNPILIDETSRIIAGHARVAAASLLSQEQVPTICITGLSDAQRRALVIADNKLALNAAWDMELLQVELDDLRDMAFDIKLIGFEPQELNDLIGTPNLGPPPSEHSENDELVMCPKCGLRFEP